MGLMFSHSGLHSQLFLRGKPRLHERMKRLPSCHRKTPIDKDDSCPNFYELAKTSPLPEVAWTTAASNIPTTYTGVVAPPSAGAPIVAAPVVAAPMVSGPAGPVAFPQFNNAGPYENKPPNLGDVAGTFPAMNGFMGGANFGANPPYNLNDNNAMLSLLGMNGAAMNGSAPPADMASINSYTQTLQRENENLMLKIKLLEYENQARQQQPQQGDAIAPKQEGAEINNNGGVDGTNNDNSSNNNNEFRSEV